MLVTLATYFRIGLHKGDNIIPISQELLHVRSYLDIERMRFPELFTVSYDIDEAVLPYFTIKIILQPIVENSIKHGFKGRHEGGRIHIRSFLEKENVVFEITDNGCGLELTPGSPVSYTHLFA